MTRYVHTNLVARDWRRLARFYERVFDCRPVPPERDLAGDWLARGTGVEGAALRGMHLRLPGSTATLEVFEYASLVDRPVAVPNGRGFGHLAFAVDDVAATLAKVIEHGGSSAGELVERDVPGAGRLTFVYARDPEGNLVELQRWTTREVSVLEGYDRWAESYDNRPNPTRDADAAVVRAWLSHRGSLEGCDVLELGCGTGKNTAALADARRVLGLDLSEAMLARNRARHPWAELLGHDLQSTPWPAPSAAFDLALANLVLEHLPDVRPVFRELKRVLRPGGRALVVELHPYRQWSGKQARFVDPQTGELLRVSAHSHSVSEFSAAAQDAGLDTLAWCEFGDDGKAVGSGELPRLISIELVRAR